MHTCSMTKVISLSDKAYDALKNLKKGGESFSDVVLFMAQEKKEGILDFAGRWHGDHNEMDEIFRGIFADRKKSKSRDIRF